MGAVRCGHCPDAAAPSDRILQAKPRLNGVDGLQGLGFAIVWGWRRPIGSTLLGVRIAFEPAVAVGSVLVAVASGLFGVWAVRTLGKQWSLVARLADTHELN